MRAWRLAWITNAVQFSAVAENSAYKGVTGKCNTRKRHRTTLAVSPTGCEQQRKSEDAKDSKK